VLTLTVLGSGAALAARPAESVPALAEGRLISRAPLAGAGPGGPFLPGLTLDMDVGAAVPIPLSWQQGSPSLAVGAAIGYQFANGLKPFVRFDVLGVTESLVDYSDLRTFAVGARYSIAVLPTPFFELMVGPAIVVRESLLGSVDALAVAGAAGIGVSLPLGRSFSLGAVCRYWLADGPQGALQTLTFQLTATANFGLLFRK
jgi:hypothetical protein